MRADPCWLMILTAASCGDDRRPAREPVEPNVATRSEPTLPAPVVAPTAEAPADRSAADEARSWSFDADPVDGLPSAFSFARTGGGPPGRWVVRAEADAPSPPNSLAQLDADDTDMRFPIAVAEAPVLADARVSARCKMVSGRVDRACGLVLRYRDQDNYLVTRANALEGNVRLYTVKDGRRRQIASWSGPVTAGRWHELAFEARGDHLVVSWDGTPVIDHRDATFLDAGRVGLWTKADSVTLFDDVSVSALPAGGTP